MNDYPFSQKIISEIKKHSDLYDISFINLPLTDENNIPKFLYNFILFNDFIQKSSVRFKGVVKTDIIFSRAERDLFSWIFKRMTPQLEKKLALFFRIKFEESELPQKKIIMKIVKNLQKLDFIGSTTSKKSDYENILTMFDSWPFVFGKKISKLREPAIVINFNEESMSSIIASENDLLEYDINLTRTLKNSELNIFENIKGVKESSFNENTIDVFGKIENEVNFYGRFFNGDIFELLVDGETLVDLKDFPEKRFLKYNTQTQNLFKHIVGSGEIKIEKWFGEDVLFSNLDSRELAKRLGESGELWTSKKNYLDLANLSDYAEIYDLKIGKIIDYIRRCSTD